MSAPLAPEDRILLEHGLDHPAVAALTRLMAARSAELNERLLAEEGSAEFLRLQGAVRELKRWAYYPGEIARRVGGVGGGGGRFPEKRREPRDAQQ